jgi:hypothetical protein
MVTQGLALPAEADNPDYDRDVACTAPSRARRLVINLEFAPLGEHGGRSLLQLCGGFMI